MPCKKKHNMEPVNGVNTRMADQENCEHYDACLTAASKNMEKQLPCLECKRYKKAVIEREYFQRRFDTVVW